MSHPTPSQHVRDLLACYFWSHDALRSRSVSDAVLWGALDAPAPPARLIADWHRETSLRLLWRPATSRRCLWR